MDSEKMASFAAKAEMDTMLQTVLELMDSDDGKDFEEKRKEAIEFLSQKKSRNVAEILVDLAIDDQTGKEIASSFWAAGQPIQIKDELILRAANPSDRETFLEIQRIYSPMRSMLQEGAYRRHSHIASGAYNRHPAPETHSGCRCRCSWSA